jgi:hypothetical protein
LSVAEVRHDRRDPRGGGPPAGVGQREQLNEMIVDRRRGRLHQEHLLAAHRGAQLHGHLAVREPVDRARADRHTQLAGDGGGQRRIRRAGEDGKLLAHAIPRAVFAG